jgi:type I restriction enzyme S subunit
MEAVLEKQKKGKYATYQNSNTEWLGKIPKHWEVKKLKYIFQEKKRGSNIDLNCGSISFGRVVLKDDEKIPYQTKKSYQVVLKGDFLINPLNLNYDLVSLRIALSELDVVVSSGYIVINSSININKDYFKWLLHRFDVSYMKLLGSGVRQTLNYADIGNCNLILPPISEQTAIAKFLNLKTTSIDQAIDIKQKQINLLKERKQILIQKAITRGVSSKVKLKDSGFEWVKKIPQHWQVKRLRYIANCFPSNVDKHSKENEKKVRLCNYTDVYKNDFIADDMELMEATATNEQIKKFTLVKGDIVITKDSETASDIAVPAYVKEDLTNVVCGYHLAIIRPYSMVNGKYLFRALQCKVFNIQFELCSNGITRVGLGNSDLKKGLFFLPPMNEQIEIAQYIDNVSQKIITAVSSKEKEIEKLKEYKAILIHSAVTGKIKVC